MLLTKVISGGQTGADQGALRAAKRYGIPTGGTAPKDFRTEVGCVEELHSLYGLQASNDSDYLTRTEENVKNSSATLILSTSADSIGTAATIRCCRKYHKPYMVLSPELFHAHEVLNFIRNNFNHRPGVLNVAGNRESVSPGATEKVYALLLVVLHHLEGCNR